MAADRNDDYDAPDWDPNFEEPAGFRHGFGMDWAAYWEKVRYYGLETPSEWRARRIELENELAETLRPLHTKKLLGIQAKARASIEELKRGDFPKQDQRVLTCMHNAWQEAERRFRDREARPSKAEEARIRYNEKRKNLRREYEVVWQVIDVIVRHRRAKARPALPTGDALEALLYGENRDPDEPAGPLPGKEPTQGIRG